MSVSGFLFLAFYGTTLLLCLFRHPVLGLYGYVLVFYLDPASRWWGAGLPSVRWSFLLALATIVSLLFHRNKLNTRVPVLQVPFVLMIIYVAWMWLQIGWAVDPAEHAVGLNFFTKYLIVIFLILMLITSVPRMIEFISVNIAGGFYLGYLAWQSGGGGRLDGVGGPGIDDANSLGMQMSVVAFFAAAVFLVNTTYRRWFVVVAAMFIVNTIVLAGSRGAFLAFVAAGLVFFLFRPSRQLTRIALFGSLGVFGFAYLASDYFLERMTSIGDAATQSEEMDKSARSRFIIIDAQIAIAKRYPLGGGHQTTTALSDQYIPVEYHSSAGGRSSHNTFMSALVDQGIPGFILWICILLSLIRRSRYVRKVANQIVDPYLGWINASVMAGIAVVSVAGMFAPYIKAEIYIWLLSLMCCLYGIAKAEYTRVEQTS